VKRAESEFLFRCYSDPIKYVGLNGFAVAGCGTVAGCADPGYDFEGRELISASSLEERIA